MTKSEASKKKRGGCITKFCGNGLGKGNYCHKCAARRHRENNPVAAVYSTLKQNAKRRGKPFNMTVNEFRGWCAKTGYIAGRGIYKENLTIDRIKTEDPRGYHVDNIQALKNKYNVRKYHAYESRGLEIPEDWKPDENEYAPGKTDTPEEFRPDGLDCPF